VRPAPAPLSFTLAPMVNPPANVPGPTLIVSPSCAAASASGIVEKQPGLLASTQRSCFGAGGGAARLTAPVASAAQQMVRNRRAFMGDLPFADDAPDATSAPARRHRGHPGAAVGAGTEPIPAGEVI